MGKVTPYPAVSHARGPQLRPPEPLASHHDLSAFDCGNPDLNDWLIRQARRNEGRSARTYVLAVESRVIGYYCLAVGQIMRGDLPTAKMRKNAPDQIPVIVLGRLAVDVRFTSRGFGTGLLQDAFRRSLRASEAVGVRAILVHSIDEGACAFYCRFGFLPFPTNPLTLVLPLETAREAIR
jgi:GNAT superfamily N-acetyltransferase